MIGKYFLTGFLILILIVSCSTRAGNYHGENIEITVEDTGKKEENPESVSANIERQQTMVNYEGKLLNIFFHPLVARPEIAFTGIAKNHFMDWFVTADEYRRILHEMYTNNYVLVNIDDFYEVAYTGNVKRISIKTLMVPEGKKPFVLSVDDLSYYKYMRNSGTVHKLIIDHNERIAAWTADADGGEISYDLDIVTITEDFIREHPDFSVRGARGIIALTGFEGVLGYQTQNKNAPGYFEEVEGAVAVANKLKELGWRFASHSYNHWNMPEISVRAFQDDTNAWDRDVKPILGDTNLYVYPFGSGVEYLQDRHRVLRETGFNLFFIVGPGWEYYRRDEYLLICRRNIDGIYFREYRNRPDRLFDIDKVIDRNYRTVR